MNTIRIYIVDDEPMAITYLKYLLGQISTDYEVVGEATNSKKALTEILKMNPDIVFMDINMPIMDGLTLAEEVLKKNPMKIFLLTSYRDFDFVKKGIQIGVTDYILKNDLTEKSLQELLEKTSQELCIERREQYRVLEYNVRRFLMDHSGQSVDSYIYVHKPLQRYALIGIYPKEQIYLKHQENRDPLSLDCYEIHNLPCQKEVDCSAVTQTSEQEIYGVYFIHGEAADGQEVLKKQAEVILKDLEEKGIQARCIVSMTGKQFTDLPLRYEELHKVKDYLYGVGSRQILLQQELENREKEALTALHELQKSLEQTLQSKEKEESIELLQRYLEICCRQETVWEYTESLRNLFRLFREHLPSQALFPEFMSFPESFAGPEEAENWLLHVLETSLEKTEQGEGPYSPYVQKALDYIREHYRQDLAVPDVADAVGVSEGHLRRLFKRELQMKMVDYLMDYRLECAKALMKKGNVSVGEVWQQTGFTSAQYFSYVFKKKEGVLPKDYIKGKKGS